MRSVDKDMCSQDQHPKCGNYDKKEYEAGGHDNMEKYWSVVHPRAR